MSVAVNLMNLKHSYLWRFVSILFFYFYMKRELSAFVCSIPGCVRNNEIQLIGNMCNCVLVQIDFLVSIVMVIV